MSYEAAQWALHDAPMLRTAAGKPDVTARFVLVVRAERADPKGRGTYADSADMVNATGLDARTIERAERRLERAGLLVRDGCGGYTLPDFDDARASFNNARASSGVR